MKFIRLISYCFGMVALPWLSPGQLLDLSPTSLQAPSALTNSPNPFVTMSWCVATEGAGFSSARYDGLYATTNPFVGPNDYPFTAWYVQMPSGPHDVSCYTNGFTLPMGVSGNYYLIFKTDVYNWILETNENNNVIVSPFKFEAVPPDLTPLTLRVDSSIAGPPNPFVTLDWAVTNLGPGIASSYWIDALYLSTNATWTPDALLVGLYYPESPIAAGGAYWQTRTVQMPVTQSGTYYLIFKTDFTNSLFETNFANNTVVAPVSFTIQQPDLAPVMLLAPTNVVSLATPRLDIVWGVTNQGPGVASVPWQDGLYLSTNAVFDAGEDLNLFYYYEYGPLAAGGVNWRTNSIYVPVTRSGTYYLVFKTDVWNSLVEADLSNNTTSIPVTFTIQQPDLKPISLQVPTVVTSTPNPFFTITWGVTNQGNGSAKGYWNDRLFLSRDAVLDSGDQTVYQSYESSEVEAGQAYWRTTRIQLPITQSGSYYLIFNADTANSLNESDGNNNTLALPINLSITPPNLAPLTLQAPANFDGTPYPSVQVVWGVTNQGVGAAEGYWSDHLYFSTNSQVDANTGLLLSSGESGPVIAGGSYWRTNTVRLPATQSGTYYLIFKANDDTYSGLFETDFSDNTKVVPIALTLRAPDLAPVTSRLPSLIQGAPNPTVTFVWGITNQGTGAATGASWYDYIYLSTDPFFDWNDSSIGYSYEYKTLEPGRALWMTNTARVPATTNGTYYFIIGANRDQWLFEQNYSNNTVAVPVKCEIRQPDITPVAFQVPPVIDGPPYPAVTLVWGVTNQGMGEAVGNWAWYDHVFISTNMVWDPTAYDVSSYIEQGPVAPGGVYWRTNTVRLPLTSSGVYYVFLGLDFWHNLAESDSANNTVVAKITFNMQLPDLAPVGMEAPRTVTGPPYPSITYSWGVTNQGIGAAIPYNSSWSDVVAVSTDPVWNNSASQVYWGNQAGPVAPGQVYWQTNTTRIPVTQSGTYYLLFNTDANQSLFESDKTNNIAAVPITFNILPPDLAPVALLAPKTVTSPPYPNVTIAWGVTNQGIGPATADNFWTDSIYVSQDAAGIVNSRRVNDRSENGPIQPGNSYWRTNKVQIPVEQSGTYYLVLRTDEGNSLYESKETNNALAVPITFNIQPPDLGIITSSIPNVVTGSPNPSLTIAWGVTNQGVGAAIGRPSWSEEVYLSKVPIFDRWHSSQLASRDETGPLEAGTALWLTNSVDLPVVESGTNYLIFAVNDYRYNRAYESDYSNNIVMVPVAFDIQKPDLLPFALQIPRVITGPPNPLVNFSWGVTNQGRGEARPSLRWWSWTDVLYFSTNAVLNQEAHSVYTSYESAQVPGGGTYWINSSARVPVVESGTYYFILQADANGSVYESDYSNNVMVVPVTFNILPPDLIPVDLRVPMVLTTAPNPRITLSWGVTNQGTGMAEGYWGDAVYLSTNSTFDSGALLLSMNYERGPTLASDGYWRTNSIKLPIIESGNYFVGFQANAGTNLYESDYDNNFLVEPISLTIVPPDLAPITLKAPDKIAGPPNLGFEISWGVTNKGPGWITADQSWVDEIYLSKDPPTTDWSGAQVVWHYEDGPVALGESYWRSDVIQPSVTQSGTYYLTLKVNDGNSLFELDASNNTVTVPIAIQIDPPDLVPLAFQAPSVVSSSPNPTIQLTWGVTNQGAGPAIGRSSWADNVYLSTTSVLSAGAPLVTYKWETGPAAVGGSYWRTQKATVPVTQSGDYFLIFRTDDGNGLAESNYTNNTVAMPVHFNISQPDLAPIAFQTPTNVLGAPNPVITLVWGVTNQGAGDIPKSEKLWGDYVYLSTNAVLDTDTAQIIGSRYETGPVPASGTYWRTNVVRVPITEDGTYYLFFQPNAYAWAQLLESDYSNNVAVAKVTFHLSPPDLVPFAFQGPAVVRSETPRVNLQWGVTNQGPGTADGSIFDWTDVVTLTKTNRASGSTEFLGSWGMSQSVSILPGQTNWSAMWIDLPIVESGDYCLTLNVDAYGYLDESVTTNNSTSFLFSADVEAPEVTPIFLGSDGPVIGAANPKVTVIWGVTNQGGASPQLNGYYGWSDFLYISTNAFLDASARLVNETRRGDTLPAGGGYWQTNKVRVPVRSSGDYYLILKIDGYDSLHQPDATNHIAVAPINIKVLPSADLAPAGFLAPKIVTTAPYPTVTFVWGVTNQGLGPADLDWSWSDKVYLSSVPVLDGSELIVGSFEGTNNLARGGVYWRTNTARIPVTTSGNYYLIFQTARDSGLPESDYGNNTAVSAIQFNIAAADLAPFAFQAPAVVVGAPQPGVTIVVGVTNRGAGPALTADDALYLSVMPVRDPSARLIASWTRTNTIAAGGSYWLTNTVRLPAIDSGQYFLIFEADNDNPLNESDILNNQTVLPIQLALTLPPDLAVTEFESPKWITGPAKPKVQLVWHVINQGIGPTAVPWTDVVLLRTNLGSDPGFVIGRFAETNTLAVGKDYWRTNTVTLPVTQNCSFYLNFCADRNDDLYETDQNNNGAVVPVSFLLTAPTSLWVSDENLNKDGAFELAVQGSSGATYLLQSSTDLNHWVTVGEFICTNSPTRVQDRAATNSTQRYYRVIQH